MSSLHCSSPCTDTGEVHCCTARLMCITQNDRCLSLDSCLRKTSTLLHCSGPKLDFLASLNHWVTGEILTSACTKYTSMRFCFTSILSYERATCWSNWRFEGTCNRRTSSAGRGRRRRCWSQQGFNRLAHGKQQVVITCRHMLPVSTGSAFNHASCASSPTS